MQECSCAHATAITPDFAIFRHESNKKTPNNKTWRIFIMLTLNTVTWWCMMMKWRHEHYSCTRDTEETTSLLSCYICCLWLSLMSQRVHAKLSINKQRTHRSARLLAKRKSLTWLIGLVQMHHYSFDRFKIIITITDSYEKGFKHALALLAHQVMFLFL